MFLRAGALSLALLVASRLLGLLRESAVAGAFGASALADITVLMLALPDWLAGVLASGAMAYVLVPAWSRQTASEVGEQQRRLTWWATGIGVATGVIAVVLREPLARWLVPGLSPDLQPLAAWALAWSAAAFPAAMVASLWATRLQHERDFTGMYAANLVVNGALVVALGFAAFTRTPLLWVGVGLLAAAMLRLSWLRWRMPAAAPAPSHPAAWPARTLWIWAALSAGLPLALPFAARSLASQSGEGALATFNYAWKLVELPLMLAIQLVSALALPSIARAFAEADATRATQAVRSSLALAWTLACAAAAALLVAAPALARLLFGWGRMDPVALAEVATWGALGAWSLLPQALIAVGLNVLATRGNMKAPVFAYALALAVLLGLGAFGVAEGGALMVFLDVLLAGVAVAVLWPLRSERPGWVPWRAIVIALAVLLAVAAARLLLPFALLASFGPGLAGGALAAGAVIAAAWWGSADLRAALTR